MKMHPSSLPTMLQRGKSFLLLSALTWTLSCILTTLQYSHLLSIASYVNDDNRGRSHKPPHAFHLNSTNNATDGNIPVQHVVFLVVGAIRTLEQTHKSIMANVVWPLCIVTHLSHTDNQPDLGNDPIGKVIGANETNPEMT
jgi:hypothetical protein